jgi:hypothetical protein
MKAGEQYHAFVSGLLGTLLTPAMANLAKLTKSWFLHLS